MHTYGVVVKAAVGGHMTLMHRTVQNRRDINMQNGRTNATNITTTVINKCVIGGMRDNANACAVQWDKVSSVTIL